MSCGRQTTSFGAKFGAMIPACLMLFAVVLFPTPLDRAVAQPLAWVQMNPVSSPSARAAHDMAYDAQSDRVILFGGLTEFVEVLGETWAYDFDTNTWTVMNPTTEPSARSSHAMAYDAGADRVILFGGVQNVGGTFVEVNDTWAYDFNTNTWTNRNPAVAPSPRLGHRMAYDAQSDRTILLGGHRGRDPSAVFFQDTWSYNFNANLWSERAPATHPEGGNHGGLVYHEISDQVIHFGGYEATGSKGYTWAYDVDTNRWTDLRPITAPTPRFLVGIAYDAESIRVVLFGGTAGSAETWVLQVEANEWTRLDLTSAPSGRNGHRMAYDRQSDRIILFGGGDGLPGTVNSETWSFNLNAVVQPPPPADFLWIGVAVAATGAAAAGAILFLRRRKHLRAKERKGA